jgi:hypothetical protein
MERIQNSAALLTIIVIVATGIINFSGFAFGNATFAGFVATLAYIFWWIWFLISSISNYRRLKFVIVFWGLTLLSAILTIVSINTTLIVDWAITFIIPFLSSLNGLRFLFSISFSLISIISLALFFVLFAGICLTSKHGD